MHKYYNVARIVEPKRKALAEANASLQVTMKMLAKAKNILQEVTDSITMMSRCQQCQLRVHLAVQFRHTRCWNPANRRKLALVIGITNDQLDAVEKTESPGEALIDLIIEKKRSGYEKCVLGCIDGKCNFCHGQGYCYVSQASGCPVDIDRG